MNVKRIYNSAKLVSYAVSKRLQGYHLLRNPKGSSPLQLSMIKHEKEVNLYGDIVDNYRRLSKDFKNSNPIKKERLKCLRYSQKEQFDTFKSYQIEEIRTVYKGTNPEAVNIFNKRKLVELNKLLDLQDDLFESMLNSYYKNSTFSRFNRHVNRFGGKVSNLDNRPANPNFFKVLISNLKNN